MTFKSLPHRVAGGAALLGVLAALGGPVSAARADSKVDPPSSDVQKEHAEARCHYSRSSVCWRIEHRHE